MVAGYQTNRGAAYSLSYHIVWCPEHRRPVLVGSVADRLRDLIGHKCDEHGWSVPALEVMPDHVHLVVRAGPDRLAFVCGEPAQGLYVADVA